VNIVPSSPPPSQPWRERLLAALLLLIFTPGWQATLKVALLTLVFVIAYVMVQRPV
jgi:hypothetical protein